MAAPFRHRSELDEEDVAGGDSPPSEKSPKECTRLSGAPRYAANLGSAAQQQRMIGDAVATSALAGWSPTVEQITMLADYVAGHIRKAEHFAWVVEHARIEEARI